MNYKELISFVKTNKITGMRELIEKSGMPYLKIVKEFENNNAMKMYGEMLDEFSRNYKEKNKL